MEAALTDDGSDIWLGLTVVVFRTPLDVDPLWIGFKISLTSPTKVSSIGSSNQSHHCETRSGLALSLIHI